MRNGFLVALASVLCLGLVPLDARAGSVRVGGEVYGAFNTYAMNKLNDRISAINDSTASDFDSISNSFGGGLGLRVWAGPNWMLSAVWEPLFGTSKDRAFEIDTGANAFQFTAGYFFPSGETKLGVGAGIGFYMLDGEIVSAAGRTFAMEGTAVGYHFMAMAEREVSPGFSVHGAAGYRLASVEEAEIGGRETDLEVDYSGLLLRLGLAFYLPER